MKIRWGLILFLAALGMPSAPLHAEEEHPVFLMDVGGAIDPAVTRYVRRGLRQAREAQAEAVVLRLNTSGGRDSSVRKIVQAVLNSPVPVIVYVSPEGARVASTGVFIPLSAHLVAMSPGTRLGEAPPVDLGGGMDEELRGREVDFMAGDLDDLLGQAQGQIVKTVFGVRTLSFQENPRVRVSMSALERGFHQLADPTLAYPLLLLGVCGLMYELAAPRALLPGLGGVLLLIMALAALAMLEVHGAVVLLVTLGTALASAFFFKRKAVPS